MTPTLGPRPVTIETTTCLGCPGFAATAVGMQTCGCCRAATPRPGPRLIAADWSVATPPPVWCPATTGTEEPTT